MEKKKLNILMIAHATNEAGGGEDDFFRLLKNFYEEFNIYGVIPLGHRSELFKKYTHNSVIIPDKIFPFTSFNIFRYILYLWISLKKIKILFPYFKKIKDEIDICFVNSSVCLTEIFLLNHFEIPYVLSIKERIEPLFIRKMIYKYYDKTAKAVIVISDFLKKSYDSITNGNSSYLIHSAIDENDYLEIKNDVKAKFRKDENIFMIMNIGNIYELKNQMILLDAMMNYTGDKKIKLIFAGNISNSHYYENLKSKVKSLNNVAVIFAGALNKYELLKNIYLSDCVVITSKQEGMSLVLVESLFMEKPIISTPVGVVPEIIRNGENGFMLNGFDSSELSLYINMLINDKDLMEKISSNAYKSYKDNFDIEHYLKSHKKILLDNAKHYERN